MADDSNKLKTCDAPPPPMFFGSQERDLVKHLNEEMMEKVIGQQVIYYPLSKELTQYHDIYGEAIEKTFLRPVRVFAMVKLEGITTNTDKYSIEKISKITVNFHKRRLVEDQNLFVREGDFVCYGDRYFEIVKLEESRELFGQADHRFEISATCISAREGLFDGT